MTLKLTLSKKPFDVMKTGEKDIEYRTMSDWMKSRLYKGDEERTYDYVQFTNGYGKDKPTFTAEYKGFFIAPADVTFSNGLRVFSTEPLYCIRLGKII
jgi:ASC-1-like (ASCH) protein